MQDDLELIKRQKAHRQADISRTTAWRRERDDPTFPRAIQTGPNSWAYIVREWEEWINTRPRRNVAREGER
jgi:predicted DNA-binding transcriptional regulator AlpA